jgi:hypothetical protein
VIKALGLGEIQFIDWKTRQYLLKELPTGTYIIIVNVVSKFAKIQEKFDSGDWKVLYKSPYAVNKTPGHGEMPRNSLIVFTVGY